ncbi:hypothetical protein PHMEG_00031085, partial [Phytophthora megakarya]
MGAQKCTIKAMRTHGRILLTSRSHIVVARIERNAKLGLHLSLQPILPHTCREIRPIRGIIDDDANHCTDISETILDDVDRLAAETNLTQTNIWTHIVENYYMQTGPPVRGLSKNAVENRVKYIRSNQSGGNRKGMIELPPMSKVKGSAQGFFQFQYAWHDDVKAQKDSVGVDRILAWGHPELRNLLCFENLSWFVDGTFRSAPEGFKQCATIMIYDPSSELYLPVIFTLTTAMTKLSYLKLLRCVADCVGCKLTPKEIMCDFESALIGAIR